MSHVCSPTCNHDNDLNLEALSLIEKPSNAQMETHERQAEELGKVIENLEGSKKPMAHLHLHTFHSLLDGCGSIDDYVKLAKEYNHPAITILDHGTLSGTYEFYKKCKEGGIKPILGMEAYLNDKQGEVEQKKFEGGNSHQSIILMNKEGYVNINKLAYKSYDEGFYRRGRIRTDWLLEHKEGLFVTTSCMASHMARLIEGDREREAEQYLMRMHREFGDNMAIELQLNEIPQQKIYNSFLLKMMAKHDIMPVLTNDVHYAFRDDAILQDTLLSINQHTTLDDPKAFKLEARHLFYCHHDDFHILNKKFGYNYDEGFIDMCLENTLKVADKCNFDFEIGKEKYPRYEPTQDVISYFKTEDTKEIITKLAFGKLKQKVNKYKENGLVEMTEEKIQDYIQRLNYEISVIDSKNMLDYFLVNWEIIRDYRDQGHVIGPARGSCAGSLLSWCLDITKIDPIRFDLYFERFLNPTRDSPPDIDIDFMTGTDDVTTDFLHKKYGKDRVLSVATFSTFNEKGCLKDVVRAHHGQEMAGFSSPVFRVTQEMPKMFSQANITLKEWFETWPDNPDCSEEVRQWLTDPDNKVILDQTLMLQGQIRGIGQHAAGVVITPSPCWEHIPTNIIGSTKNLVTAYQEADKSGKDLSELGILKLDRLKLETLNVIEETIEDVKKKKGVDIRDTVDYVDLSDKNLYDELRLGLNHGIFQFESPGMNSIIRSMKTDTFEEVVACNALHRPGPMGIGAHTEYIQNKFSSESIEYVHPALESILDKTNGVLIFQEQLMFIANKIGGMSLGEGDMLRRFMDKANKLIAKSSAGEKFTDEEENDKNWKNFQKYWNQFLEGAEKNGYDRKGIDKIKDWIIKYLGYSFNRSHSLSYSYLAMQTLYLKHYYPTEFYTSLLNHPKTSGGKEKEQAWLAAAIASAISKGIKIKPPSRKSGWRWTMTGDKEISMGFSGISGMGDIAFAELLELLDREKETMSTIKPVKFFSMPFKKYNKTAFSACLKAGIFDDWSNSREHLMSLKEKKKKKVDVAQISIGFDMEESDTISVGKSAKFAPTTEMQKLNEFQEVCNFDLTEIERITLIKKRLNEKRTREKPIESIINFSEDDFYFFVLVENAVTKLTKKGDPYLVLRVGDGINTKYLRVFKPLVDKIKGELEKGGAYVAEFIKVKTKIGSFINFKENARFKKVASGGQITS